MAKKNVGGSLPGEDTTFHANMKGQVYARTMPEPHAPTRFFPISDKLDEDQLVALHIHEGLHRALHPAVRENESIVAQLAMALTEPEATHDKVRRLCESILPRSREQNLVESSEYDGAISGSNVGYEFRYFFKPKQATRYRITSMHILRSHLLPLGNRNNRLGLGIDMAFLHAPGGFVSGPLGLSLQFRAFEVQKFEIGFWLSANLNTLSAEELKDSPFGRDVTTLGLSIRRRTNRFYVENYTSWSVPSSADQAVGSVTYKYEYGSIFDVKIRSGFRVGQFDLGGFGEIHLADYFRVVGGGFNLDSGRYRLLSVGPEASFFNDDFGISLFGRFLLDATKDANYDFLGNVMGPGVSQGSIGISFRLLF